MANGTITVTGTVNGANGNLNVDGGGGGSPRACGDGGGGGGGSGGTIILQAPRVVIQDGGQVTASAGRRGTVQNACYNRAGNGGSGSAGKIWVNATVYSVSGTVAPDARRFT